MTHRSWFRAAWLAAALAAALSPLSGGSVDAAVKRITFEYGVDRASWFWTQQEDTVVEAPDPIPVAQRARVPNPQKADTLPVAVTDGDHEKTSAIYFDLAGRGLPAGSTINKLTISLVEETSGGEQPAFNATGKVIEACPLNDVLIAGEAEEWETRPPYDRNNCAKGKRDASATPPVWVFDLTDIAAGWGEDPFSANGVMLQGASLGSGADGTWQINLKIPARDSAGQVVEATKGRAVLSVSYQPPATPPSGGSGGGSGGFPPYTPPSFEPGPVVQDPGTGVPVTDNPPPVIGDGGAPPATQPPAAPVGTTAPDAKRALVWLLVPLGLVALAGVRTAATEPAAAAETRGVVAAIRERNAARRAAQPQ